MQQQNFKKDIIDRYNIKDTFILESIIKYSSNNIGKANDYEVDFVAENPNDIKYYQVTQSLANDEIKMREIRSLESINDNYEKIILTMDKSINNDYNGIKVLNIIDWLLKDE